MDILPIIILYAGLALMQVIGFVFFCVLSWAVYHWGKRQEAEKNWTNFCLVRDAEQKEEGEGWWKNEDTSD